LPVSPLGLEPKARRFDSCLVFHPAEPELVGPCRSEVETEVVSAVRARESRLARRRYELRPRVPHEDAVSATSKLAQWVERRFRSRLSWVRLPHLHQLVKLALERTRGFGPASRCPSGDADQTALARKGQVAEKQRPQRALRFERPRCAAPEARGDEPEPFPDAGEERVLTRRADGAATLAARGASVGHTSTYSDVLNVRRERRRNMLGFKRVTIAQHERGLVFRNRSFKTILEPGVYWIFDPLERVEVQVYDLTVTEFEHARVDFLVKEARATIEKYFTIVELGDREVGVVYKNGRVAGLVAPGKRQLYWRGPVDVRVDKFDFSKEFELPQELARVLVRAKQPLAAQVADAVTAVEVADTAVGLLIVDGELAKALASGLHAFWKYQRALKTELVDRRVQSMEVAGQEILTRDKVSLRVNLTALWQVLDVVKARAALTNFVEFLYKQLQFALREAVGTRTLDELLGDKGVLDREIGDVVRAQVEEHGLAVRSVGVKDVILPGEMKEILNQVVQAEKVAQANLIKRREETAATRSLLNTARLMDENPTLLRMKELETLEKVTEKIDKLTVFGGLEGVLKDVVRIQVPSA
jgi:regulator of protease activity HflC (stomatin/prohibitin superfamily)